MFKGNTHYRDKVLSLFEPHTEAIRKGKAAKPTEFGKLVKIQEAENQFVVDYQVCERRPEDQTSVDPDAWGPSTGLRSSSAICSQPIAAFGRPPTNGRPRMPALKGSASPP